MNFDNPRALLKRLFKLNDYMQRPSVMKKALKFIFITVLFFLIFNEQVFATICVNLSPNREMVGTAMDYDALIRGSELAFQDTHFSDYRFFSTNTNVEFLQQIQQMASSSCSVILGFLTSRECLIAGPVLVKNKIIGISFICGHDNVNNFHPYLYTATPSISQASKIVVDYLHRSPQFGKIFAVHQPTDTYSESEFTQFKSKFKGQIVEVPIDSDGQFDSNLISYKPGEKATLAFFTYPLPSVKILVMLSDHQMITKNTRIIGASSWSDDVSLLIPIKSILEKAYEVKAVDIMDWNKVKKSIFVKRFSKTFHREPVGIEVSNYDVTKLAVECYKKSFINGKYDTNQFRYCITHTHYIGESGTFSFNNNSSFATRKIAMSNLLNRM